MDYSSVLTIARDLNIPVVGLNISNGIVRKVARGGLESLSEEEKPFVPPDVKPINPLYAKLLSLRLKVHRAFQGKSLDRVDLCSSFEGRCNGLDYNAISRRSEDKG